MHLPLKFEERLKVELPAFAEKILHALNQAPYETAIRINRKKCLARPIDSNRLIPWANDAFWLSERPIFTLDPLFHAGAYYVQESSSMLLQAVLKQLPAARMAIDLSAAPGGKSTLLADALHPQGWLLANEIVPKRAEILSANLERWGNSRVVVSNASPASLSNLGLHADILLIDAPCSGEGMFRKDLESRQHWHAHLPQQCSALQLQIFEESLPLLKHGGHLIYSTCTFSLAENEQQWHHLRQKGLVPVALELPADWGFTDAHSIDASIPPGHAYHAFPGTARGEGFFLCVFKKQGGTTVLTQDVSESTLADLPQEIAAQVEVPANMHVAKSSKGMWYAGTQEQLFWCSRVEKRISLLRWGTALGDIPKGRTWMPAHALALAADLKLHSPCLELQGTLALWYLARRDFQLNLVPQGNFLVKYEKSVLGWGFSRQGKFVNCYPANEKIRMAVQQVAKVLGE